ncbi:hypothetical protein JYT53_00090 [Cytophagaceae bacterium AH-315-L13]|nr:hypothetical protein [Cytophagaceae bacterium AH-315-L13]
MKTTILLSLLCITWNLANAQDSSLKQYELNFKKAENVVSAIFYSAQKRDFNIMSLLQDPLGECDSDIIGLCSISSVAKQVADYGGNQQSQKAINEFVNMFQNGRITGKVTINTSSVGNIIATVPFYFNSGQGEDRNFEEMKLIQRYGNWYLYSF